MSRVKVDPFAKPLPDRIHGELRTSDAQECVDWVVGRVIRSFVSKSRPLEGLVREWMIEYAQGTSTTRPELEETVRRMLDARFGL